MSENKPEKQRVEVPFYIMIRHEGHMINAYIAPEQQTIARLDAEESGLKEPILIASISKSVCDTTGGISGSLFASWRALVEQAAAVICVECFDMVPINFVSREATAADGIKFEMSKPAGNA